MGRRIIKFIPLFFIILFIILTQSCPNPLLEKVEEDIIVFKAPNIVSTVPPPDGKDIFLDTPIQIRFDKVLDESTINNSTFIVKDESEEVVSGTIEYNSHTKTLTFYADDTYTMHSDYSVFIKKGIKSSDGDPLISDYKWDFSTGISTSLPDGTISAVSVTKENTVTLNFTRDNLFVTSMSVYVESPSVPKIDIGGIGRDFETSIDYNHAVTSGNDENYTFSVIFHNKNFINSDEKSIIVYIDKNPPDSPVVTGETLTNDTTPTWQWAAIAEAENYRYSFDDSTWTELGNSTSYTPSSELENNTYTFYVQAGDEVGNWSSSGSKQTQIDSEAEMPDVYITGYPSAVSDSTPSWQWYPVDGAVEYRYSYDDATWTNIGNVLSFTPSSALTDGTYTLYVQAKKTIGDWSASGSYGVSIDTTEPSVTSFRINNGSTYSTSTSVTLNSSVSGATQMRFYNTAWSDWETYSTSKTWTLTSGDGTKTVYAQYRDNLYNTTATVSDTIILDTDTPAPSISINGGAAYSTSRTVTAGVSISGDYTQLEFYDSYNGYSGFISYSGTSVTRSVGFNSDGGKTIYVRAKDAAGHTSGWVNDVITIDTVTPSVSSVSINSGAAYSTSDTRTVTATAIISGTYNYIRYYDSTNGYSSWIASTTTPHSYSRSFTSDGTKSIYAQVKDAAGNTSALSVYDSIIIDTVHPNAPTVSCSSTSPDTTPTWTWTSGGGGNGTFYREINDSTPDYTSTSTSYTAGYLPDGSHRLYVKERDAAGNLSAYGSSLYTLNVTGITPDNGQLLSYVSSVTADWPTTKGATSYVIYFKLSTASSFTSVDRGLNSYYTVSTSSLPPNKNPYLFYWYVKVNRTLPAIPIFSPTYQFSVKK